MIQHLLKSIYVNALAISYIVSTFCLIGLFNGCINQKQILVESPNGKYQVKFTFDESTRQPIYSVQFDNREIIRKSALGFNIKNQNLFSSSMKIKSQTRMTVDSAWNPVYGEKNQYPEKYHESLIKLAPTNGPEVGLEIRFRAYNEGITFRYEFESNSPTIIESELTEFALPTESEIWVSSRAQGPIEKIDINELKESVERPLMAQIEDSLFVAIGEAALVDFARMKLINNPDKPGTLLADLAGEVNIKGNYRSPWRVIMAGNTAGEILENNYLLLNLNEPNQISNTDWILPGKIIREVTLTTQGGIACVDFAAKHHLQYIEFDAGWYGNEYDDASDATTVTVDPKRSKGPLDLPEVINYASNKGIGVILYVNRKSLEKQIDEVLPLLKSWGIKGVKYGFVQVGSQQWTSWLHEAIRKAADHELMVDVHDEYRPTGYSRTYPNLMTQEGIRGDEESPDNSMVLNTLFTRMIAGAGDQTNCYFASRVDEKMGSHASQLAKAICIYSPWQFLYWYDRPTGSPSKAGGAGSNENFIIEVPELAFYDELPTTWDDTKVLGGYPGEYAVIARKSGKNWFVGAINGINARNLEIQMDFLIPNQRYEVTLYKDDKSVDSPTHVGIQNFSISDMEVFKVDMKEQSGLAMIIKEAE